MSIENTPKTSNKEPFLQQSPPIVKKLADGAEYIPIGQVEQALDQLDQNWSTSDFKFQVINVSKFWFADASCILWVNDKYMQGAVTFQISSKDSNMDFSATALSFCVSNAAKRLGIRFGRALNGRLETGETAIPIVQIREPIDISVDEDLEWKSVLSMLKDIEFKEDAQEFIETTPYRLTIAAKNIINSKKLKNEKK